MLLPRRTKSESNITTFEGRRTTFLRFELSNKVQSNVAPAPINREIIGHLLNYCLRWSKKMKKSQLFSVALQKVWTHPDDFRASIMRRSARGLEHRPHRLERGHPEVCNLDVVLVVQQKVLGLQIAVAKQKKSNLKHMEMFILCSLDWSWVFIL